jgi:hypothetical protein
MNDTLLTRMAIAMHKADVYPSLSESYSDLPKYRRRNYETMAAAALSIRLIDEGQPDDDMQARTIPGPPLGDRAGAGGSAHGGDQ